MKRCCICIVVIAAAILLNGCATPLMESKTAGTRFMDYFGYSNCIVLENENTRVILVPQCGGRVLQYSWKGVDTLVLDEQNRGWVYEPGKDIIEPFSGRFDIGPEKIIPPHPHLWMRQWQGQITGPRSAKLTSTEDPAAGVQVIREFTLDKNSSKLTCTQIIKNVSDETKRYCHWGRTLCKGGGICLIPLTANSRFPKKYIIHEPGSLLNYQPDDPAIRVRDGFLAMGPVPKFTKISVDSYAGWLCCLMKNDLMFVKRFPVYPDRIYNEIAASTVAIWYYKDQICELEPIGPMEIIGPGKAATFTEEWWLLPYKFPGVNADVDFAEVTKLVDCRAR